MRLIDLCDPLFRYVSSLKRALKRGAAPSASTVRSEVLKILGRIRASADDPDLLAQVPSPAVAHIACPTAEHWIHCDAVADAYVGALHR